MNRARFVTPVTPYLLRVSRLKAFSDKACDTVTPVTPYTHRRARTRARTSIQVSHVSQVSHSNAINNLICDTQK